MFDIGNLKKIDLTLTTVIIILCVIGAGMVFSTSYFPDKTFSKLFFNQIGFYVIGFLLYLIISLFNYKKINNWVSIISIYTITLVLLISVLLFGDFVFEARRWLTIGSFTIQPSEFSKLSIIFITAFCFTEIVTKDFERLINIYKAKKKNTLTKITTLAIKSSFVRIYFNVLALISIVFLIIAQKSLGNTIIIILIFLSIVFITINIDKKILGVLLIALVSLNASFNFINLEPLQSIFSFEISGDIFKILLILVSAFISFLILRQLKIKPIVGFLVFIVFIISSPVISYTYNNVLLPYQRNRIETFLNPDPKEALSQNYNKEQAVLAIGSGGFSGQGYLSGTVTNLGLLPFASTDFVFASFSEQFGFIGVIFLFCLYLFLIIRILMISQDVKDRFGKFIIIGIFTMIALNTVQHIGMNLGILPITGVPLPLISYGGSNILTVFIGLGFVQAIAIKADIEEVNLINLKKEMNI